MLIDPQSKMNIKTIDPHLKLTPTQGINYQVFYQQLTEQRNAHATMHMPPYYLTNKQASKLAFIMDVFSVLQRI